ncbi:hypothetical protein BD311DRAFT_771420 [Dichomitus squalens]|uniref:Transmembrane protein n=1 Tax=Dichomitus squalens TaxID=114155 RepID=A0A4Q9M4P9_9APHY|nr:hypothetical protein BD311DRAFT_771420 [Dichomitus squalens]
MGRVKSRLRERRETRVRHCMLYIPSLVFVCFPLFNVPLPGLVLQPHADEHCRERFLTSRASKTVSSRTKASPIRRPSLSLFCYCEFQVDYLHPCGLSASPLTRFFWLR